MKNKKTLLSIVLVFAVLMGGAYVLYDRLGRNVGTEQMIVHADQQQASSAATEGDSADPAGKTSPHQSRSPRSFPRPILRCMTRPATKCASASISGNPLY